MNARTRLLIGGRSVEFVMIFVRWPQGDEQPSADLQLDLDDPTAAWLVDHDLPIPASVTFDRAGADRFAIRGAIDHIDVDEEGRFALAHLQGLSTGDLN